MIVFDSFLDSKYSYRSADKERHALRMMAIGTSPVDNPSQHEESVEMSIPMALSFLCWACIALVGLYYLLMAGEQVVVIAVICMYTLVYEPHSRRIGISFFLPHYMDRLTS